MRVLLLRCLRTHHRQFFSHSYLYVIYDFLPVQQRIISIYTLK